MDKIHVAMDKIHVATVEGVRHLSRARNSNSMSLFVAVAVSVSSDSDDEPLRPAKKTRKRTRP